MTGCLPPPLLAVTPGDLDTRGAEVMVIAASRAVAAGLRGVLLREPMLPDRDYLAIARKLGGVLAGARGWLGLHDRPHLVAAAGAQGVHLGFRSLSPFEARAVVGDATAIGLSTHAGDEPSCWRGCEYRFFGPVKETPSKVGLVQATGFEALADACSHPLPVWAIGGLTPGDVGAARAAGAAGVAVRAGVLGAADPALAAASYLEALA